MLQKNIKILFRYTGFKAQQSSHYQVLGLPRTATTLQIKKKYYQLAKIYHPDVCKDSDSNTKFNKITIVMICILQGQAYEILVDQVKKKQYDQENPARQAEKKGQAGSNMYEGFSGRYRSHKQKQAKNQQDEDPFTTYDQYFKNNRTYAKPKRGADININLTIKLEESIVGVKKQVMYTQDQLCDVCSHTDKQQCFCCGGKGTIFNRIRREKQQCQDCHSKGYINNCEKCSGSSYTRKDVKQTVYISKNTHNKTILRLEGLGHQGFKSNNGDLYITVFVEDSSQFKIDGNFYVSFLGNNIHSEYQLDFLTATLGGMVKIKTVYGMHDVKIEPGTQSGQEIRLFNLGLTSQYSRRKGDQIVKFKIKVPSALTQKQKQLLSALNL